jgi:hypothetical protein
MVHPLEGLRAAFVQDAGAVDDRTAAGQKGGSRFSSSMPIFNGSTCPTSPIVLRNFAASALRHPTATTSPRAASRLTM